MWIMIVAIVLTIVALARNGRYWKRVLFGWLVVVLAGTFIIAPMQAAALERLQSGYASGSVFQNFGPFGSAVAAGVIADSYAEAQRMANFASTIDLVLSGLLISMLLNVAGKSRDEAREEA
jgi:phosphodiesterase/alkaline phosphatase D-like protein